MSLLAITFDVQRETVSDDAGGGETRTWSDIYTDVTGTLNYVTRSRLQRYESGAGQSVGQAPITRMQGVLKLEPVPTSTTIRVNDRIQVSGGDTWLVWGKRTYERTQQFDVETLS